MLYQSAGASKLQIQFARSKKIVQKFQKLYNYVIGCKKETNSSTCTYYHKPEIVTTTICWTGENRVVIYIPELESELESEILTATQVLKWAKMVGHFTAIQRSQLEVKYPGLFSTRSSWTHLPQNVLSLKEEAIARTKAIAKSKAAYW